LLSAFTSICSGVSLDLVEVLNEDVAVVSTDDFALDLKDEDTIEDDLDYLVPSSFLFLPFFHLDYGFLF